jgi:hypothetical protein
MALPRVGRIPDSRRRGQAGGAATWRAAIPRSTGRPAPVVGGEGTAITQNGKITPGKLAADETIVYVATPDSTLGDDVVVKGWKRPAASGLRFDDLPSALDLSFDPATPSFSGEGIETWLAGAVHVATDRAGFRQGLDSRGAGPFRVRPAARHRPRALISMDLDNPGLDIVALRRNLAVEGCGRHETVMVPVIQLVESAGAGQRKAVVARAGLPAATSTGADLAALQAASPRCSVQR